MKFCTFTQDRELLFDILRGSARALVVWGCLSNKHFLFMRFKVQTFTFSIISTQQSALFTQSLIWSRKCAKNLVMIAIYELHWFLILKIVWLWFIFDELLKIWLEKKLNFFFLIEKLTHCCVSQGASAFSSPHNFRRAFDNRHDK